MTTFEMIMLMIEEDVRADIHGDLYGHERVASYWADLIDAQAAEIAQLKTEIESLKAELDEWAASQPRF
jgi:uncharacterized small protein (DUF1192 family)